MVKELYNWEQLRAYGLIALNNILESNEKISLENFMKELDPLQSLYGKDGIVGFANKLKDKNV